MSDWSAGSLQVAAIHILQFVIGTVIGSGIETATTAHFHVDPVIEFNPGAHAPAAINEHNNPLTFPNTLIFIALLFASEVIRLRTEYLAAALKPR